MKRRRILVTVLAFAMLAIAIRRLFAGRAAAKAIDDQHQESDNQASRLPANCTRPTAFNAKTLSAPRQAANQVHSRDPGKAWCGAC